MFWTGRWFLEVFGGFLKRECLLCFETSVKEVLRGFRWVLGKISRFSIFLGVLE